MNRRAFLAVTAVAASPRVVLSQQRSLPLVGFLSARSARESTGLLDGFRSGVKDEGFVEGQNVRIEYRWADAQFERLPALAAELVALRVSVMATVGGPLSALAAKAATSTIPIVFALVVDPVQLGLVLSLSQPGGNITRVAQLGSTLTAKRLQLLRELVPDAGVIGVLINPKTPDAKTQANEMQDTARKLANTSVAFSKAQSPHSCRSCNRRNSTLR